MTNLSFEQQAEFDAITDYEERIQKLEDLRSDNILLLMFIPNAQKRN